MLKQLATDRHHYACSTLEVVYLADLFLNMPDSTTPLQGSDEVLGLNTDNEN